jgi:hypothetical protein
MKSYNRQQTVHLLPINFDTADLINSFLYDEVKTVMQNKKKEIVKKFENASYSRKNNAEMFPDDEEEQETNEIWAICLTDKNFPDDENNEEMQFQSENCKKCGNYKLCWKMEPPENIKCMCHA